MARDKTDKTDLTPAATLATTATRATNEWGIPDWRDASAYGDTEPWTFNRWRWEFYRRRDDLREVFLSIFEMERDSSELEFTREGRPPRGHPGHFVYANTRWLFGYSHRLPDPTVSGHPEELLFCYESEHATWPPVLIEWESAPPGEKLKVPEIAVPIHHGSVVVFDLDRPLEPQFKAAQRSIRLAQSHLHGKPLQERRREPKWFGYLRALDAREARATWTEIADTFFAQGLLDQRKAPSGGYMGPPPQAARDMWKAADALRFNF